MRIVCAPAEFGDVRRRQVDHEKPSIRVDRNVALASVDLLAGVVAAGLGGRRFHRLAVDHAGGRARLPPGPLAVDHQRHVVDRLEQETAHEAAEPPINRLPGRKILRSIRQPQPARAM